MGRYSPQSTHLFDLVRRVLESHKVLHDTSSRDQRLPRQDAGARSDDSRQSCPTAARSFRMSSERLLRRQHRNRSPWQ